MTYDLHAFCTHCGETHAMGKTFLLEDGPAESRTVADTYKGKATPELVVRLRHNAIYCREKGNFFHQEDDSRLFLVPLNTKRVV